MSLYPTASELPQVARQYKSALDAIYRLCNYINSNIDSDQSSILTAAKELNNSRRQINALRTSQGGNFNSLKPSLGILYGIADTDTFVTDAENVAQTLLIDLLTYIKAQINSGTFDLDAQTGDTVLSALPANVITEIKNRVAAILAVY